MTPFKIEPLEGRFNGFVVKAENSNNLSPEPINGVTLPCGLRAISLICSGLDVLLNLVSKSDVHEPRPGSVRVILPIVLSVPAGTSISVSGIAALATILLKIKPIKKPRSFDPKLIIGEREWSWVQSAVRNIDP